MHTLRPTNHLDINKVLKLKGFDLGISGFQANLRPKSDPGHDFMYDRVFILALNCVFL